MRTLWKKVLIAVITAAMICPIMKYGDAENYLVNHASAEEEKTQYRIMPLGDSITAGYCPGSDYQFGGYRMYLADSLEKNGFAGYFDFVGKWNTGEGYDMDNNGTNGVMIANDDWGDSITTDILENGILDTYQPDIILLQIGTNDILGQDESIALREVSKINERLENLINIIIENMKEDAIIFLASIPYMEGSRYEQYNDDVTDYNLYIQQLVESKQAEDQKIYFVDINSAVSEGQYVDGVHPDQEGYAQMGELWYETIMAYFPDLEPMDTPTTEPTLEPTTAPTTEPTVEPTTAPTVSPTVAPTGQPTVNPAVEPTSQPKGTVITKGEKYRAQGMTYQVTKTGKSNAVRLVKASTAIKNKKTVKVPDKVKVNGVSCSVTGVGKNVFKNAKVQRIILGKNITDVQNSAFANCRKLKQIQFQGKNWKRVASGAGKKTTGVKFVVPKGKEKTYQVLIKKAGFKKYKVKTTS